MGNATCNSVNDIFSLTSNSDVEEDNGVGSVIRGGRRLAGGSHDVCRVEVKLVNQVLVT